eukprot:90665-Hanusia_phi.AAC.1
MNTLALSLGYGLALFHELARILLRDKSASGNASTATVNTLQSDNRKSAKQNRSPRSKIIRYKCKKPGHTSRQCNGGKSNKPALTAVLKALQTSLDTQNSRTAEL